MKETQYWYKDFVKVGQMAYSVFQKNEPIQNLVCILCLILWFWIYRKVSNDKFHVYVSRLFANVSLLF